jgi:hypothetical protein
MKTTLLLLMMILAAGCDQATLDQWDVQKQYPTYPEWGWWDNPAESKDETKSGGPSGNDTASKKLPPKSTPKPVKLAEASDDDWPDRSGSDEEIEETAIFAKDAVRKEAWPAVQELRSLNDLSDAKQQELLTKLKQDLPGWYKQLGVTQPTTTDPNWQMIVLWDFMPNASYWHATEGWRTVAKQRKVEFPDPITRRKLVQFILKMTQSN